MNARDLIDREVDNRLFVLDLGEDAADVKYLEIELPRFSTWYIPGKNLAPELVMLHQAMKLKPKTTSLTEALTKTDKDEMKKLMKKEMEDFKKQDKKDDLALVKNVLVSFVKSLYSKRSGWMADLSGDKSS